MSDRTKATSERDPLQQGIDELRREVPVRAEWRAELLHALAVAPPPAGPVDRAPGLVGRRGVQLTAGLALAAAVGFALLGASLAYLVMRGASSDAQPAVAATDGGSAATVATPAAAPLVTVRFMLVAPSARSVALVGDFNRWDAGADPMHRAQDGQSWTLEVGLRPGRHAYAFVVDDAVVPDPAAPSAVGEDFGVRSSVVLVSETTR